MENITTSGYVLLRCDRDGVLYSSPRTAAGEQLAVIHRDPLRIETLSAAESHRVGADIEAFKSRSVYYHRPHIGLVDGRLKFIAMPACTSTDLYFFINEENDLLVGDDFFAIARMIGECTPDTEVCRHFELRNTAPAGLTLIKQIRRLKPFAVYAWESGQLRVVPNTSQPLQLDDDRHAYEVFQSALTETLRHELRDHERVGLLFSGGVDSTLLGLVTAKLGKQVSAVTAAVFPRGDAFESDVRRARFITGRTGWEHDVAEVRYDSTSIDTLLPYVNLMPLAPHLSVTYDVILRRVAEKGIGVALCGQNLDTLYNLGATTPIGTSRSALASALRRFYFSSAFLGTLEDVAGSRRASMRVSRAVARLGVELYSKVRNGRYGLPDTVDDAHRALQVSQDDIPLVRLGNDRPTQLRDRPIKTELEAYQKLLDHKITEYLMGGVNMAPHAAASRVGIESRLVYGSELMVNFFRSRKMRHREILFPKEFVHRYAGELAPKLMRGYRDVDPGSSLRVQDWFETVLAKTHFGQSLREAVGETYRPSGITQAQIFNCYLATYWMQNVFGLIERRNSARSAYLEFVHEDARRI